MIIDGGLSNALEQRGHDLSSELWTAELLRDAPHEIAAVHRAYFEAGAQVATTASYQASVSGFVRTAQDVTGKPGVAGVAYVGGCCRIGPADIAALAESLA